MKYSIRVLPSASRPSLHTDGRRVMSFDSPDCVWRPQQQRLVELELWAQTREFIDTPRECTPLDWLAASLVVLTLISVLLAIVVPL